MHPSRRLQEMAFMPKYNKCYNTLISHIEGKAKENSLEITWINKDYHSSDEVEISFIINGNLYLVRFEYINNPLGYHTKMTRPEFFALSDSLNAKACYAYIVCDEYRNLSCKLDGWGLVDPYSSELIFPEKEHLDQAATFTDWELHNLAVQKLIETLNSENKVIVSTSRIKDIYPHIFYASKGNGSFSSLSPSYEQFIGTPACLIVQAVKYPDKIGRPINNWSTMVKKFRDSGHECKFLNVCFRSPSKNFLRTEELTFTTFDPEMEFLTNPEFSNYLGSQVDEKSELSLYKNICSDQYNEILRLRKIEAKYLEMINNGESLYSTESKLNFCNDIGLKILKLFSLGVFNNQISLSVINATNCLQIISELASHRVVILKEAWKSAKEIDSDFKNTTTLLKLLSRLVTDFYDESLKENGNPKSVFTTNEYAATESDTTIKSTKLQQQRLFKVQDRQIQMNSHLKIGTADNVNFTLRIHFVFDKATNKVLIGWCGKHLDVSSR